MKKNSVYLLSIGAKRNHSKRKNISLNFINIRKRMISSLLCVLMLLSMIVTTSSQDSTSVAAQLTDPILVVVNSNDQANSFGTYMGEILKAEGFNAYKIAEISDLSQTDISSYNLIILTALSLTHEQSALFSTYVYGGGNLIALKPEMEGM